ncbi:MAG: sel1 repeat family protein, partial [Gammaproteobacteria bacterium]|nr:sel1 repeat family protein [Gammaproteobacteria bacterium]
QFNYAKSMEAANKAMAFVWYRSAAENNHPKAQYYVSQYYLSGHLSVSPDIQLSFDWLYKAAEQALPLAQLALGQHYISGLVIKKNVAAGMTYCELAAKAGLVEAIVFLGQCYEDGTEVAADITRAQNYYRRAAKLAFIPAIIKLAPLLAKGTLDNKKEAIKWYRQIAAKNNIVAYYPLATLLSDVLDNQAEAFKWYLKAAENKHPEAQYELGLRFKRGLAPCSIDAFKSADFFGQAARVGHANAQFRYATCLKEGDGVEKNDVEAMLYFKRLADDYVHAESQYQYALLKDKQTPGVAYTYYLKAAQQGHVLAQYACIEYQINSDCDLAICLDFCERLTPQGNIELLFVLARLLDSGIAGEMDKAKAYRYYALAANNNHILAHYYCAIALEEGEGVNQNGAAARKHYEACLKYCTEAKPRLARLLLQEQDYENHEINAIKILKSYYIKGAQNHLVNLHTLESAVERLITNRLKNIAIFAIDSINTSSIYANYSLGRMLIEGKEISQDTITAMKFFKKAANCGHAESCYQWALSKSQVSPDMAYIYFKKAALQNHELAQSECIHYQLKHQFDLDICLFFCEKLAIQSDPLQFVLARLLDTGIAGKADKLQAYHNYLPLAEKGHPLAQYYCAMVLEEGLVVQKNLVKARQYYESASKHCFPAMLRLACLLLEEGCQKNENKIMLPLTKDQIHAIDLLVFYHKHHQDDQLFLSDNVEQNVERLLLANNRKQLISSLQLNNTYPAKANYLIGRIVQEGKGVDMDNQRALQYYRLARLEEPDATYRMGYLYETGQGVVKNVATAKSLYQYAADRGHQLASKRSSWSYRFFSQNDSVPDDATLMKNKESNCLVS